MHFAEPRGYEFEEKRQDKIFWISFFKERFADLFVLQFMRWIKIYCRGNSIQFIDHHQMLAECFLWNDGLILLSIISRANLSDIVYITGIHFWRGDLVMSSEFCSLGMIQIAWVWSKLPGYDPNYLGIFPIANEISHKR